MESSDIVELYWQRSEYAISETQAKYGGLCTHIAQNILSNNEDVQECVNDTYLGVWNAIPSARPNVFSAFVCRITRNTALKKYHYISAQKRNPELESSLTELEDFVCGNEDVESKYQVEQLSKAISNFLRQQDYDNRNIFLRRYWYYDSIKNISTCFNMSESKVKSMLFRTRNKLKDYLLKEGLYL